MTFHMNGTSGQARGQGRLDAPEDLLRAMVQQLVQETIQSEFEEDIRDLFTSDPARMVPWPSGCGRAMRPGLVRPNPSFAPAGKGA